jgi:ribosome maturation factor RimP
VLPLRAGAFPGGDLYIEVSSPGTGRIIRDGSEFIRHIGRTVACYRTDISDWTAGVLVGADERALTLEGKGGKVTLNYEDIAKAKLQGTEKN